MGRVPCPVDTEPPARGLGGGLRHPDSWEAGRQIQTAGHVSCRATPAPRRLAAAVWVKARLLSRPGSVRGAGGARPPLDGEHPRGASLTQGPAPRFSFNCSGDCRHQREAAGRTGVVVSCLDSNLGFSICHLHELKHSIILLGHRFLHV